MSAPQIRPLGYALGAEVRGIDLRAGLTESTVAAIRNAWLEHIVLCFPEQDLNAEDFMAFCEKFGPLDDNRSIPHFRDPIHDAMTIIVNKPTAVKNKLLSGGIADEWHTDLSYTDRPASASFLNAKALPDVGGNTMFANLYTAYETLSPAFQAMIEGLEGVHDTTISKYFKQKYNAEEQELVRRLNPPVVHPVVRVHPETGRKALYVGNRVRNFVGMTEEESVPLRDFLNAHATRYEFTYRHTWRLHDVVMWDNRCALHRAVADYDLTQLRQMTRCELLAPKSGYYLPASAP